MSIVRVKEGSLNDGRGRLISGPVYRIVTPAASRYRRDCHSLLNLGAPGVALPHRNQFSAMWQ